MTEQNAPAPFSVKCPTCGKKMIWSKDNPFRPFCSEQCRMIDLGEWASGGYRIEGAPGSADGMDPGDFGKKDPES